MIYERKKLPEISDRVKKGELIVYPTDTVYGLGATIDNLDAIERIYKVKSRAFSSPLIALVSKKESVKKIAELGENREAVEKLMDAFWPGALTIILEKKDVIPAEMVSGTNTVGIRMPNLDISLEIIEACGGILATTSANISGNPSAKCFEDLDEKLLERIDIEIDGGSCIVGIESTILDMRNEPKIIRMGGISKENIEKILGMKIKEQ
jgi:L-threonylcarbamoyladenylate synthase